MHPLLAPPRSHSSPSIGRGILRRWRKYVIKALKSLELMKPMESPREAMLRLARKYSVVPVVIERSMHKWGRLGEETQSDVDIENTEKK